MFGHPKSDRPIDESFPYRPALGDYGKSKAEAEQYCLGKVKTQSKMRIVVISPSAVYGPSGPLFTELPARMARAGEFCWVEDGRGKLNYVFVDNLVDALILAAANPKAHGERFIVNDGVTTFREFLTPPLGGYADGLPSFSRRELIELGRSNRSNFRDLVRAITNDEVMRVVNTLPALAAPKHLVENRFASAYERLQRKRGALRAAAQASGAGAGPWPTPPAWLADIFGPIDVEYSSAKATSRTRVAAESHAGRGDAGEYRLAEVHRSFQRAGRPRARTKMRCRDLFAERDRQNVRNRWDWFWLMGARRRSEDRQITVCPHDGSCSAIAGPTAKVCTLPPAPSSWATAGYRLST